MKKIYCVCCLLLWLVQAQAQENWETLNKNSMTAFNAKDYDAAFNITVQALAAAEKEYGIESPRYALSTHNLAYMYSIRKSYPEAEKYYLKALEIREKLKLEGDYAVTVSQYGAMLHRNIKDMAKAEKYLLIARDLNKKLYTEKSSQYYGVASELGMLYFNTGRYKEAEPYYIYQVETTKQQKGVKSEDYALRLKDLMQVYDKYPDKTRYAATYDELLQVMASLGYDDQPSYFQGMLMLASFYEEQQLEDKAVVTYQTLLPAIKKNLGDTSSMYLMPLIKLAGVFSARSDYKNMSIYAVELLDILKRKPGERAVYLTSLEAVSVIFRTTGDYTRAEATLLEYTAALKKDLGTSAPEYLLAMRSLGDVQLSLGKHKEAIQTYRDAMSARKQKDAEYAADLTKAGYVLGIIGKLAEAEKMYNEAMQIFKAVQKEQTNEYAVLLNYLGMLYSGSGRAKEGEELLLKAKAIYAATVGVKHPNYAVALANLAAIYMDQGNYNLAEQLFLQQLDIKGQAYGKEHPEYAYGLIRTALFYKNIGNNVKWEQYLLDALEIQKKALPDGHPSLMTTLNNLAVFYNNTRQYDKAEPYYLQSMEISRKNLGERVDYLNTLNNLSGLYVNLKNFDKATEGYNKAMALAKKLYGEGLEYAGVLQGMALMYDYKGEYQKAEPYFVQSFELKKKLLSPGNPAHAGLNMNLGMLYQAMKNYAKAEPFYAKASELMLTNIDKNFAFLSESEKQDFLNTLNYRFEQFQNFYLAYKKQQPQAANKAYDLELATKGLTLNAGIEMRKSIAGSGNAEALKVYDDWMKLRAEIAKLSTGDGAAAEMDALEQQAVTLEKQLTRLSGSFNSGRAVATARFDAVKSRLGENDVAIEFASFRQFDDVTWKDSVIYVALVLRKNDANVTMIRLCEGSQLAALIQKKGQDDGNFVSNLYSTRGIETENDNNSLANGKKLYDLIWKPIDQLLKPGNRIYFAPSGILHQIAFAAIPYGNGKLLSDQYKLSQLSSTAVLLKPNEETDIAHSITLFGGIKYDLPASGDTATDGESGTIAADVKRGAAWTYLPGTLTEAEKIAKMAAAANYTTQTHFGADGQERYMKQMNGKNAPGIIHIASHGFFFPDPELNYRQTNAADPVFSKSSNAMNRSGMLFAGANAAWTGKSQPGKEDGILTAYEASNLSLSNTSLVVLSACETGLGDIKGNEGVYGLQRSFKMAGANYLMMSLWKVPDAETSEFMQYFYTGLFGGKGIETSFTAAQDAMKTKYPKTPYKWAAFVLVK